MRSDLQGAYFCLVSKWSTYCLFGTRRANSQRRIADVADDSLVATRYAWIIIMYDWLFKGSLFLSSTSNILQIVHYISVKYVILFYYFESLTFQCRKEPSEVFQNMTSLTWQTWRTLSFMPHFLLLHLYFLIRCQFLSILIIW